jgi:DNA-binding response OmpR family regulator
MRALIVDDDPLFRTMLERAFAQAGFVTAQARSGPEALQVLEGFSPELLVLDIWMPGEFDGVEACRRVRADRRFRDLIIVMMSGADKRKETDRCLQAGANLFIPKPFSPKHFLDQIGLLLREKGKGP